MFFSFFTMENCFLFSSIEKVQWHKSLMPVKKIQSKRIKIQIEKKDYIKEFFFVYHVWIFLCCLRDFIFCKKVCLLQFFFFFINFQKVIKWTYVQKNYKKLRFLCFFFFLEKFFSFLFFSFFHSLHRNSYKKNNTYSFIHIQCLWKIKNAAEI